MSIATRIRILEERAPQGYTTFDIDGRPVIQSAMDGLDWYESAIALLRSRGRDAEKAALRAQLARSRGDDNGGGRLYELIDALDCVSAARSKPSAQRRVRPSGT